jgi:hypothetical protein
MKSKALGLVFGAIVATASVSASAFGLGNLTSAVGGGSKSESSVTAQSLVDLYLGSGQSVMNGQAKLLEAVGLKTEAEKAEAASKNMTKGATKDNLEDAVKVQTEGSKALADKKAEGGIKMTAEAKKIYTAGLLNLAVGLKGYVDMASSVSSYKPGMSDLGAAAGSAMFIVKSLPNSTQNVTTTIKQAMEFAKENKIEIPKEASAF